MSQIIVRKYSELEPYQEMSDLMHSFSEQRTDEDADELWFLQHQRVFTQGQAGKAEHILAAGDIPVIQSDRGGQVTYHGPGQLVVYCMIDLKRKGVGPRFLVSAIEQAIVDSLAELDIEAYPKPDAPGVYVSESKVASLGLRIRKGKSFHGLALNVDMDLEPFLRINPCGYAGMEMTQVKDLLDNTVTVDDMSERLLRHLLLQLGYENAQIKYMS
jgi:lipoyl(octanoyl) transferase